jgi:hypothetical protein
MMNDADALAQECGKMLQSWTVMDDVSYSSRLLLGYSLGFVLGMS